MTKYILSVVMLIGFVAPANHAQTKAAFNALRLCDQISEIKRFPVKGEPGVDSTYDALIAAGDDVIPCLIERITDTTPMHDPRCPAWAEKVAVGDTAYYVLLDKTDLGFADLLPKNIQERYKTERVLAFDKYIRQKGARRQLQSRLHEWYRKTHS